MPEPTIARKSVSNAAAMDILSGTWILACNDENPVITYEGITDRLSLDPDYNVRALVASRRELFRPGLAERDLEIWKEALRKREIVRPTWVIRKGSEASQLQAIDSLTGPDVFRSQFRTGDQAQNRDLKIITWGLEHIDRLRKSAAEEAEQKSKRWTAVMIPLASILLAAFSAGTTFELGRENLTEQSRLKLYEVSFKPKQDAYSKLMVALSNAIMAAGSNDQKAVLPDLIEAKSAYFPMEPFLTLNARIAAAQHLAAFSDLCAQRAKTDLAPSTPENVAFLKTAQDNLMFFERDLFADLFSEQQ